MDVCRVRQRVTFCPAGLGVALAHRFDRQPFIGGDHGEVAAIADQFHLAGKLLEGGLVDLQKLTAAPGRAYHPGVQHIGQPHVLHIGRTAADFGRDVQPRQRFADQGEAASWLEGRVGRRKAMQLNPHHCLCVGHAAALCIVDHRIPRGQAVDAALPLPCCGLE